MKYLHNTNISLIFVSAIDITGDVTTVAIITKSNKTKTMSMEKKNDNLALTEAVYYILLTLKEPLHGYGIMQQTEQMSNGRLHISAGTLYGALSSLLEKGWIKALDENPESRKKEYVLTAEGETVLNAEYERLLELVTNGKKLLNK